MEVSVEDAIAFIDSEVDKALEESGIDPDATAEDMTEEEKTKKRKRRKVQVQCNVHRGGWHWWQQRTLARLPSQSDRKKRHLDKIR